jgi:hypothetical protein
MSDLLNLAARVKRANTIMEATQKKGLEDGLRLLAMNIAHYRSIYGEISLSDTMAVIGEGIPNLAQIEIMEEGMQLLCEALGEYDQARPNGIE